MSPTWNRTSLSFEEFFHEFSLVEGQATRSRGDDSPWVLDSLPIGETEVSLIHEGAANFYEGRAPDDLVTLVIALPTPRPLFYNAREVGPGRILLVRPGDEFTSYSEGDCRYACFTLALERFVATTARIDPTRTEELLTGSHLLESRRWPELLRLLARLRALEECPDQELATRAHRALVHEVTDAFVGAAAAATDSAGTGRERLHRRTVERVREALRLPEVTTVADLARTAEVSDRTLRNVMTEQFGVSPKRYLMLRQLHAVRADLLASENGETVKSVATQNGVWELGRFAGRYRELFGEAPSVTLARA